MADFEFHPSKTEIFESPDVVTPAHDVRPSVHLSYGERKQMDKDLVEVNMNPSLAFEKFAGTVFDTAAVDFSDSIDEMKLKIATVDRSTFVSHEERARDFESPLQRFDRLRLEIREFERELGELAKLNAQNDDATGDITALIVKELNGLKVSLDKTAGASTLLPTEGDNQGEAVAAGSSKTLQDRLATLSKGGDAVQLTATGAASPPKSKSTVGDFATQSELTAHLEERLTKLESVVGKGTEIPPMFYDIRTALSYLAQTVSALEIAADAANQGGASSDASGRSSLNEAKSGSSSSSRYRPGTLSHDFRRRVQRLTKELDLLGQRRDAVQGKPETKQKIDDAYAALTKMENSISSVPLIIDRLLSLKEIHHASAGALARLQDLEAGQQKLDAMVATDRDLLQQVTKNVATVSETWQSNMANLDERFKRVTAKMEELQRRQG